MSNENEREFALTAAAQAFCNRGVTIACPWEGDLDDREREIFDALVAAIDSYNTIMARRPILSDEAKDHALAVELDNASLYSALSDIVACTHRPNPIDPSWIDVAPGKHHAFQVAIEAAHIALTAAFSPPPERESLEAAAQRIRLAAQSGSGIAPADVERVLGDPRIGVSAPSSPVPVEAVGWITNCCNCGRIIDKREAKDGGDPFGAELSDGRWTCSIECYDAVIDLALPAAPAHREAGE